MSTAAHQHRTRISPLIGLGLVAAVGVQTLAVYAGIASATHLPWLLSAPVALGLGTVLLLLWPLVATLVGCASAILVWHWPWVVALALFLPLGVVNFMVGGTVGMAWLARAYGGRTTSRRPV